MSLEELADSLRYDLEQTPGVLGVVYRIGLTGPAVPYVKAWREVDMRVEMQDGTGFRVQMSEREARKP